MQQVIDANFDHNEDQVTSFACMGGLTIVIPIIPRICKEISRQE